MKAVISDKIYLQVDTELKAVIKSVLSYKVPVYVPGKYGQTKPVRTFKIVKPNILAIPAGRFDLIPDSYEIKDKRVENPVKFPNYVGNIQLRSDQQVIYDQVDGSCIINAQPGWGKTFTGLAIARKLGQKTLVITHTVFLREQWEKQVEKMFGIKAGVIGSGRFEIGPPIVVANIQTLTSKHLQLAKEFGTLIVDECHKTPAATFLEVVNCSHAKNKIGLSATIERKDGYHIVLRDVFGDKVLVPPVENQMTPTVILIDTGIPFEDSGHWATRVNNLVERHDYVHTILDLVVSQEGRGHKTLVVSDRVDLLKYLHEVLAESSVYVGGETETEERGRIEARLREGEISTIFGSIKIFSEGISIDCLSCLIIATMTNNDPLLTQLIGRITREEPGKMQPEVLDLQLKGSTAKRQAMQRLGLYMKLGFPVKALK